MVGKIDPILSRGISLDYLGVRNWALGRGGALNAISELEALGVARIGGDVYQLVGKNLSRRMTVGTANKALASLILFYFKRSSDKSKSYILSCLTPERLLRQHLKFDGV
jgi:hypothetical protein